ncbi:SRPBCC family protein [Nocardia sp. MDA0666]|uniref:SRPBCC family protein n=1 Tax=Nocardia sp. MDA0666 TaxID=2135448 RepID=UPI000D1232E6|nr:SRPBCC family protein [Nocardia sp. MDA0666]PSR69691.1 SRPBCC family protein [Nocardia sp. MDA0666]
MFGRKFTYQLDRRGPAAPEAMFDLIRDAEGWPRWAGPLITYATWRDGKTGVGDDIVGRVRLMGTPRFRTPEQITVDDRPHVHAYRILTRWPVRDYHARVEFTSHDDGTTTVRWSGEFIERIPGTGWLWKRFLLRFLGDLADNLLIAAAEPSLDDEQRDAGPDPGRTADHA